MATFTFDRVVIVGTDGERRSYTVKEFLALPLHTRIRHVLARELEFYLGDLPVDQSTALKSLRT